MDFLVALQSSDFSHFLQTSSWAPRALEILHYFGIILWLGAIVMLDMRLIGFSRTVPLHNFHLGAGVWTGLALTLLSGLLMFSTNPVGYIHNIAFWVKIMLIIAASLTALVFHTRHVADSLRWDKGAPPLDARIAGIVSLCLWGGVLIAGRLIAYVGPSLGTYIAPSAG